MAAALGKHQNSRVYTPEGLAKIGVARKLHASTLNPDCNCRVHGPQNHGLSAETRAKISASLSATQRTQGANALGKGGTGRTDEQRQRISAGSRIAQSKPSVRARNSEARKEHADLELPDCNCWVHRARREGWGAGNDWGKRRKPNANELRLYACLELWFSCEFDRVLDREIRFDVGGRRFYVDAFVASRRLVFEADSKYFHDELLDEERDTFLLSHGEVDAVIRLSEDELKQFTGEGR